MTETGFRSRARCTDPGRAGADDDRVSLAHRRAS
jgi:hypothetical protein